MYYYPYSRTYLRARMAGISLGLLKLGIYSLSTFIAAAGLYWAVVAVVNFF